MAVLRRRDRRRDQDGANGATDLDLDAVGTAVLDTAEAALGTRPDLTAGPEAVLAGAGPDAFSFELATADPGWSGLLVARTSDVDVLANETGWIRALDSTGYPVPEVVADRHDDGVVIFRPPAGVNLAGCMVDDFMAVPRFLAAFGQLHARLHALSVDDLVAAATAGDGDSADGNSAEGDDDAPLDELLDRAEAEAVRAEVDTELTWLDKFRPGEAAAVLCHGELNPVHVYVEGSDTATAVPVNWTRARLAPRTFDVAATLTAFWTSPLYVDGTVQRTALKMIRDSLMSAYVKAYTEASPEPLDDEALRYWQAFHLGWLATDLARRIHDQPVGPWDPATAVPKPADALQDLRQRFWELAEP
ncbi:MAG TPA: phosphotransferase [Acidimicrobiales bacterium]|nr:phosphotransferase [Acidimicrobiales bacterium]